MPHLRLPSIDHGIASFLWAAALGFYVYLGLAAIGISQAVGVILAGLAFGAIFLFVRIFGDEELRQPRRSRGDRG